jgi:hypothetical protein
MHLFVLCSWVVAGKSNKGVIIHVSIELEKEYKLEILKY